MKRIKSFLHIMLLLITVSFTAPVFSQSSQYALYNYRNDGNFNAWLNLDIEKITYSCIDTLGVEHDDIVVQEVWTADSVYRIPLEAIDSIGFRAPAPVMREGIFYLDEYHAAHTLEIDSLTLYFDTSIDRDRLPSLGQVVLHNTFSTPYEEGFAGRVKTIEEVNGRIKIDCEMLCVGDVYKHLVLVGSAQTMTDEEADVASARTRGDGDPWIKYEEAGEMPIRKIGDLTFTIFDGLISVVSKDPTLQVKYMVYVDEDIYHISANCQLTHNNLQYGVNLNLGKLCEIDDTIKVDKELKEITQALKRLQDYKEMSADEWVESFLNEKIQKGNKEKLSDDETKVLGGLWDKLHGSWTIPIGGPFVLDLELGPLFKPKGSLELSFMAKTKARNTFYVEARGYTMATLANPRLALATGLAHIDGYSNFHSEPISSLSLSAKAKASLSIGIIGKVSVSLIHKSIVHATVSGQGGLKLGGSLEAKWDSESWYDEDYSFDNFYDYFDPLYDALKDTKIKAELFANFGVELGLTPWSFLSVGAEWEAYNNELGSCYLFPHFSKPSFPVYYHDKEQWSNGNFNNHLTLQSLPTKNIPDLLLGPCNIGMRIIDEEGKTVRETEDREYKDDGTIIWQLYPLEIDLKGLEPGKSYRCYPVLHYHDWYKFRATPSYEFTVPEPVSVKRSSLSIKKGDTKDITVSGGWGCYEIINDKNNIVTAYFSDEGEVTNSGDSNNSNESGGGGGGSSWTRSSNDVISSGGAGGGGYDWGPSLIWTSSWPTDETPTLHIKGTDVGEATVQVKDMRSNETTSIKVVVTDEEITSLELSSTSLALSVGKDGSVDITSGSGEYTAESSNTDIATVTINNGSIKVTAITVGTTTITVTDTETGQTASVEVKVKEDNIDIPAEAIDLGLPSGILWASYNIGATKPEDFGGYYAWGETEEKDVYDWISYIHCNGTKETCYNHSMDITNTQYDVAHTKWGDNWRMPTKTEIQELLEKTEINDSIINGVKGCVFIGYNGNSIFLPYSGINSEEGIEDKSEDVYFWSSSLDFNDFSKAFQYNPGFFRSSSAGFVLYNSNPSSVNRSLGLTVRPIYSTYVITPQAFDLGEVPIGEPKDVQFTVANTGTSSINVCVSCDNCFLDISDNNVDCTIEKGQSKTYTIKFNVYGGQKIDERIKVLIDNSKESYVKICCKGRDAYAVFNSGTLTFYCDDNRESREGKVYDIPTGYYSVDWRRNSIDKVVFTSSFAEARPQSTDGWFDGLGSLTEIDGIEYLNTSYVTDMGWMFRDCTSLRSLDLGTFNTSKVTRMAGMFTGCSSLKNLDVSHFDTSAAIYLYDMFSGCSELSVLDVRNFNISHAHEIQKMFMGCSKLKELDLSNFDTSNVSYMNEMFCDCTNLKKIYCGEKWTMDNVLVSFGGMSRMFDNCISLVGGTGTKYDSEHTDGEYARIDGGPERPGYFTAVNSSGQDVPAEAVDLGLPSGTLWASYNVGATKPEEVGGYYAWGETEEKDEYEWSNYSLCDGTEGTCSNIGEDIGGTQYDVAHVKWGPTWRMPTVTEWEEVIMNCSNQSFTMNGVNGILLTSRNNGNSIFIPVTGCRWDTGIYYGDNVYCWLSEQSSKGDDFANYLQYRNGMIGNGRDFERYIGLPVRPVYDGSWGKPSDGGPSDGEDNGPYGNDDDGLQ